VPRSLSGRVVAAGAVVALLVILALAWSSIAPAPSASPGPSGVASHRASDPPSPDPADASQASSPGPSLPPTTAPSPPMSPAPGEVTLAQLLSMLTTQPENRIGYDRALFAHWIDADGDGCDTRKEVLIGESRIAVTVGPNCSLSGGSWLSSYDDVPFTDPSGLDIDHMVPLAEAWDSGAWSWSAATRQAFANDIGVGWSLIAVSASSNRAKSDQDPADWLPPEADAWCGYLGDWLPAGATRPTRRSASRRLRRTLIAARSAIDSSRSWHLIPTGSTATTTGSVARAVSAARPRGP